MARYDSKAEVVTLGVVFALWPIPFVALRFYWRCRSKSKILLTDWLMVPALLVLIFLCMVQITAAYTSYLGQHMPLEPDGSPARGPSSLMKQYVYMFICVDKLMTGSTKISILLLYRNVFAVKKHLRWLNDAAIAVVAIWVLVLFPMCIAICRPPSIFWGTNLKLLKSQCFDYAAIYLATVLPDFLTDVMVMLLPIPQILGLNMTRSQKVSLCGIFMLGGFAIATGAIRIWVFTQTDFNWIPGQAIDVSYGAAPALYWTTIHGATSIVCACLPTLRGLLRQWQIALGFRRPQSVCTTRLTEKSSARASRPKYDDSYLRGYGSEYSTHIKSGGSTPEMGCSGDIDGIHVWHEVTVEESESTERMSNSSIEKL